MYQQLTGAAAYREANKQANKEKKLTPEEAALVMSWDDMSTLIAEEEAD